MDWERELATALLAVGQSGYWSAIESPAIMLWHMAGLTPVEIAAKLIEGRQEKD